MQEQWSPDPEQFKPSLELAMYTNRDRQRSLLLEHVGVRMGAALDRYIPAREWEYTPYEAEEYFLELNTDGRGVERIIQWMCTSNDQYALENSLKLLGMLNLIPKISPVADEVFESQSRFLKSTTTPENITPQAKILAGDIQSYDVRRTGEIGRDFINPLAHDPDASDSDAFYMAEAFTLLIFKSDISTYKRRAYMTELQYLSRILKTPENRRHLHLMFGDEASFWRQVDGTWAGFDLGTGSFADTGPAKPGADVFTVGESNVIDRLITTAIFAGNIPSAESVRRDIASHDGQQNFLQRIKKLLRVLPSNHPHLDQLTLLWEELAFHSQSS